MSVLLTAIIFYLIATMAVGVLSSRLVKNSKDFVLAGRSLPLFLSASALFATWFGSETIFGASSEYMENGLLGVIEDPFGASLCLLLFGAFYIKPIYRMNVLTLGDVYRELFGRRVEILASLFMIPAYFGYVAAQLVAFGLILGAISGIPVFTGILISTFVVVFYTFLGGMWAISLTDFIQTIIILFGLIWVAVLVTQEAGGIGLVLSSAPEGSFRFFPEATPIGWISYLGAWSVIGLGSIPSQDIYQRAMSSKSEKTARRSLYLASGFYLTFGLLPLFIALGAKVLFPQIYLNNPQMLLPEMVLQLGSLPVQIVFFGALLSAIMSTTSSGLLAPSAIIAENLIKPLKIFNLTENKMLRVIRVNIILVAIVAVILAYWKANIYELVAGASISLLVSLFVPLTAGLFWPKSSAIGAIWSIYLGMASYLLFIFIDLSLPSHVLALLISTLGMMAGSYLYPDTKNHEPLS